MPRDSASPALPTWCLPRSHADRFVVEPSLINAEKCPASFRANIGVIWSKGEERNWGGICGRKSDAELPENYPEFGQKKKFSESLDEIEQRRRGEREDEALF